MLGVNKGVLVFASFRATQRGASLVEFALVVPVVALLVFGLIESGSLYNDAIAVRHGVREGARHGVLAEVGSDSSCALDPPASNAAANRLMCLTKRRIGLGDDRVRVAIAYGPSGYAVGQPLAVCAQVPVRSLTGFFSPFFGGQFMRTKVEMRIQTPTTTPPAAARENAPSGATWDFCRVTP